MGVLLALGSALAYGLSDFVGGLVSRRTSAWAVAVLVQVSAALSTAVFALVRGGAPTPGDLAWAVLAGVGSGAGVGFLFRGFSSGRMSVVAPLSAVGAALLPVVIGLATGERPGLLVTLAIVAAFPGIWMVASGEDQPVPDSVHPTPAPSEPSGDTSGVLDGILAGLGFGIMFAGLGQVPESAGMWPLTLTQAVSAVAAALLATVLGASWRPTRSAWRALPAGPLSAVAVVCFQLAVQSGLLTVSAVLASLYPAATILLAMALLRERIHRMQGIGLVLCGATVVLVTLG
ncbi:MAG TPA: DMT family transporter [Marmoricola sp.]|nr:DMT family transporter [Marmoricola sp.]